MVALLPRLASLDQTILNAIRVLGKPGSRRWRVFHAVNGRRTAPDIAKILGYAANNVSTELGTLYNRVLIEQHGAKGKAIVYTKIPELKNLNLRPHAKGPTRAEFPIEPVTSSPRPERAGAASKVVTYTVIRLGQKYHLENITPQWVEALVALNFAETAITKFLMDHGFQEDSLKKTHWDEKIDRLIGKVHEEARARDTKPRNIVLNNLKNLRTTRNDVDHQAHLAEARITDDEVQLILRLVRMALKYIFEEHKKICELSNPGTH